MAAVDIEGVGEILREVAATEVLPRWRNLAAGDVSSKSHAGDLVTIADRVAEAALAVRLEALLPGSRVIGEEGVHADPAIVGRFRDAAPVWVIDPIDGTRAFTEGREAFDVMVALVEDAVPVAGWILAPVSGRLFAGERGSGTRRQSADGTWQLVSGRPRGMPLTEMQGVVTPQYFLNRRLPTPERHRHRFRGFTRHISSGHNYARLLDGEADFLINFSTHAWDHMAGLALTSAAGFHARRHDGRPFDPLDRNGGVLVAPDEASWHEILSLLVPKDERS